MARRGSPFASGYEDNHAGFATVLPYSGLPDFSYPLFFGLLSIFFSFGKGLVYFAPGLLLPPRGDAPVGPGTRLGLPGPWLLFWRDWCWSTRGGGVVRRLVLGAALFLFASIPASFALAVNLAERATCQSLRRNVATLTLLAVSCGSASTGPCSAWRIWGSVRRTTTRGIADVVRPGNSARVAAVRHDAGIALVAMAAGGGVRGGVLLPRGSGAGRGRAAGGGAAARAVADGPGTVAALIQGPAEAVWSLRAGRYRYSAALKERPARATSAERPFTEAAISWPLGERHSMATHFDFVALGLSGRNRLNPG